MSDNNGDTGQIDSISLASEIVTAYVSNNKISASEIPALINETYDAIAGLRESSEKFQHSGEPAVPIDESITPDYIICLEDGKELKMLKRYLRTHYGLSPEDYRRKWGLPSNYPMTAPNYSKHRSKVAKNTGLGKAAPAAKRKAPAKRPARAKK